MMISHVLANMGTSCFLHSTFMCLAMCQGVLFFPLMNYRFEQPVWSNCTNSPALSSHDPSQSLATKELCEVSTSICSTTVSTTDCTYIMLNITLTCTGNSEPGIAYFSVAATLLKRSEPDLQIWGVHVLGTWMLIDFVLFCFGSTIVKSDWYSPCPDSQPWHVRLLGDKEVHRTVTDRAGDVSGLQNNDGKLTPLPCGSFPMAFGGPLKGSVRKNEVCWNV